MALVRRLVDAGLGRLAEGALRPAFSRLAGGRVELHLPGGTVRRFGRGQLGPCVRLDVHNYAAFARVLRGGEIGAGEAFAEGLWSSPDLVTLLELFAHNRARFDFDALWVARPWRWASRRLHTSRRNTVVQSRGNIAAHYDLSNELFALFLDETMAYSSAVFERPEQSLAEAQRAKFLRMAQLAGVGPGSRVLEIGGGWGGFAVFAAETFGCRVTTITISPAQLAGMQARIAAAGLEASVTPLLLDYRQLTGTYDAIVSIEMLEAVGAQYLPAYFEVCERLLRPGGRLAVQVIAVPERRFARARDGVTWIQKYIFPGGDLPSLAELERSLARTDLLITGVSEIGQDYARTLQLWRERFLQRLDGVRALGFDERFIRTWIYYLAICEAGFRGRFTQDLQVAIERPVASWDRGERPLTAAVRGISA